jgi:DNA-binding MarR family transcriptional regulator
MQVARFMRDDSPREWLALGLSIAQLKSLFFINFEEETNLRNLANALGVTPPNVTGIVDRLEEQELVTREYNQLNRREQKLRLTPKGKDLVERLRERVSSRLTHLLERLDVEDLAALYRGLTALNTAAQERASEKNTQ